MLNVSIIVLAYNVEEYIRKFIDIVLELAYRDFILCYIVVIFNFNQGDVFNMEQLNNDDLKHIQELEFKILELIKDLCDKHNITYFLLAGTLLGAVRHSGFIPWDDDMDIGMFRKDYEKFIKIAYKELKTPYHPYDTYDSIQKRHFFKIYYTDTVYYEKNMPFEQHGVWVDIFPIDFIDARTLEKAKTKGYHRRSLYYTLASVAQYDGTAKASTAFKIVSMIFHMFPKSIQRKINNLPISIDKKGIYTMNYGSMYGVEKQTMPIEYYLPTSKLLFDDEYFNVPNNYDAVLKQLYGDYMEIPSIEKRNNKMHLTKNIIKVD